MKKIIQAIPIPFAGVILGLAALGNLLQSYSESLRLALGIMAMILAIAYIFKIVVCPSSIKEEMKNPIMASVAGTFPMSLMLISVYLKPYMGSLAVYLWFFAIGLHCALILYFTWKFILKFDIKKVFASYYIVYVGIAVAGVSAPAFKMQNIGRMSFYFGLASLIVLLPVVTYRHMKLKAIPEPAAPLFCIFTAPASLCLAAYTQSFATKNITMIYCLLALSLLIYLVVLVKLPSFLKLKFYPSCAAFTFPFVISAISTKQSMKALATMKSPLPVLKYVVLVQTIIATVLVAYTLVRFIMAIYKNSTIKTVEK
ncbi:exfoliative toxin A/B [Hathewaya proteolytica DSM 3090]|uniref:Exfoliative toxin A/B n=1 Tax=Hathewaya proteolytica DSM 3090 TaxID=1121331 RepID=A0A1M6KCX7_9CLOT|nr:TDT family transporter [Hathewaya proteolytica]SHJ56795.1 exfoliative toxin A/B [Hathewaya proteolytica DSM 3090]